MTCGWLWLVAIWPKPTCRFQKSLGFWGILKSEILHTRFTDGPGQIREPNGRKHGDQLEQVNRAFNLVPLLARKFVIISPLLALSRHAPAFGQCPLLGVKQTNTSAVEFHRLHVRAIARAGFKRRHALPEEIKDGYAGLTGRRIGIPLCRRPV